MAYNSNGRPKIEIYPNQGSISWREATYRVIIGNQVYEHQHVDEVAGILTSPPVRPVLTDNKCSAPAKRFFRNKISGKPLPDVLTS